MIASLLTVVGFVDSAAIRDIVDERLGGEFEEVELDAAMREFGVERAADDRD